MKSIFDLEQTSNYLTQGTHAWCDINRGENSTMNIKMLGRLFTLNIKCAHWKKIGSETIFTQKYKLISQIITRRNGK